MRFWTGLAAAAFVVISTSASAQTVELDPQLTPMQAHYARLSQAYAENDPAMIVAYRTEDFYVELPGGARIPRETAQEVLVAFFQESQPPIEVVTTIQCAALTSDTEARFIVTQRTGRTAELEDEYRQVQNQVTQTDTWRLTEAGWRLASVSDIHDQRRWIDGVEVNPALPYDPNAPAFTPAAAAPAVCDSASSSAAAH
jgi:hypothetical protein